MQAIGSSTCWEAFILDPSLDLHGSAEAISIRFNVPLCCLAFEGESFDVSDEIMVRSVRRLILLGNLDNNLIQKKFGLHGLNLIEIIPV